MNDIIEIRNVFTAQLNKLSQYVKLLTNSEESYYSEYREIMYIGIINRAYSLWETYVKDVIYEYYILKKEHLIKNGSIIKKLKLNELPAYLCEIGSYDVSKDSVYYELKKEFITNTTKNMNMDQLRILCGKFDIKVTYELENSRIIKSFLKEKEALFQRLNVKANSSIVEQAFDRLIEERNLVSHYSTIDNYVSLDTIQHWIEFYRIAGNDVCKIICTHYLDGAGIDRNNFGKFVKYYKDRKILLIDVYEGVEINKNTKIILFNKDTIENLLQPIDFRVDEQKVDKIIGKTNAGITISPIFESEFNIKESSDLVVLEETLFQKI